jgi:hypothetical protein
MDVGERMICLYCDTEYTPTMTPSRLCPSCQEKFSKKWLADRRDEESAGCFDPSADAEVVKKTARRLKAARID